MARFNSLWKSLFTNPRSSQSKRSLGKTLRLAPISASIETLEERLLLWVPSGATWPGDGGSGTTITYSYSNLLDGNLGGNLTPAELQATVEEAFTLWASYAPLHFVEQPDDGPSPETGADYVPAGRPMIRLGHIYIDGEMGADTLADTYRPGTTGLSGDIHFDDGNTWHLDPDDGKDLLEVAVHEIGHALGLEHQPDYEDAVMNPYYEERYDGPGTAYLFQDDINGIRNLYGVGTGSVTPFTGFPNDDHGDSPSTATAVGIDSTTAGEIQSGGDSDWFQFSATAGNQYVFETHSGTLSDTTLELLAQDGQTLLVFDDDGGEVYASKISWTATATGTFYLGVNGYFPSDTGTYTLTVEYDDDFGGSAAGSTALTADTSQSGEINFAGDHDWFGVGVTAGQTYRVLLDAQSLPHGKLTLYASDGTTPLLAGDGLGAGTDPWLIWKAETTGTMYVSVGGNTTETGTYSISSTAVDGLVASTPGSGIPVEVHVANASNGTVLYSYRPYAAYTGGAFVALGDVNGDGVADTITGADAGGGAHVRVISGANGAELMSFFPYTSAFTGGARVASADVNGDGKDDVITAPGPGGSPHVRVFSGNSGTELYSFFAYDPSFGGGVFVAGGDVNGDGKADIVTGAGAGGAPHLKVISGADGTTVLHSFLAYSSTFSGGIHVAAGDVNDDGKADIVTGAGAGGGPHVRVFHGGTGAELTSFFPYSMNFSGGVRVGVSDVTNDDHADIITAPGATGGPDVRIFSGANYTQIHQMLPYAGTFTGGVFVDGSPAILPGGPSALIARAPSAPVREATASPAATSRVMVSRESLVPFSLGLAQSDRVLSKEDATDLERLRSAETDGTRTGFTPSEEESRLSGLTDEVNEVEISPGQPPALPESSLVDVFDEELFQQLLM